MPPRSPYIHARSAVPFISIPLSFLLSQFPLSSSTDCCPLHQMAPSQSQAARNIRSRRTEQEEPLGSSTESYYSESDNSVGSLGVRTTREADTSRESNGGRRQKHHAKRRRRAITPSGSSDDEPVNTALFSTKSQLDRITLTLACISRFRGDEERLGNPT